MASRGFIELLRLADLAHSRRSGRHSRSQAQWVGVGFEIAGRQIIAPMGQVSEVLAVPTAVTPIPLSQPWLIGVANVRGRLLPMTDLNVFLGLPSSTTRLSQRKVIVIDFADMYCGIVVDRVFGIQQFAMNQYVAEAVEQNSPLLPYNHGKFIKDGEEWIVFMPNLLIEDSRYLEAAL